MSVAKSSFLFSIGTLLSRVSGVLRESVVGAVFGASVYMDAFVVAFRIPNLLRELLAEGALGSSFTKIYAALCVDDPKKAQDILIKTLQFVVLISFIICGLGMIFADPLVGLMTMFDQKHHDPRFFDATVTLTKILFPFIGFASVGAIVQGALYQRGGFFLVGVAPILFNLLSVAGALWFAPVVGWIVPGVEVGSLGHLSVLGLAVGTLLGGAAQSGIQIWGIWKPLLAGKNLWPKSLPWSPEIKKMLVLMAPMVIAASAGQVNVIVNTNFATSLGTGAVTWLYFAFRLVQLPIGMFGVAVGAAVLPQLTKTITEAGGRVDQKASTDIFNALDLVIWLMVPCTFGLMLCAVDITQLLYQAGRFTSDDTKMTALAIQGYSYGLVGYGVLKVMNSYYYAVGRTRFPMIVSLVSIFANYGINSQLVREIGHEGLAVTASMMLTFNSLLLILGMSKDGVFVPWKQILKSGGLLCGVSLAVFGVHKLISGWLEIVPLSSFLSLYISPLISLKLAASIRILLIGVLVLFCFGGVGLIRLQKSPRQAFSMLKRRRPKV